MPKSGKRSNNRSGSKKLPRPVSWAVVLFGLCIALLGILRSLPFSPTLTIVELPVLYLPRWLPLLLLLPLFVWWRSLKQLSWTQTLTLWLGGCYLLFVHTGVVVSAASWERQAATGSVRMLTANLVSYDLERMSSVLRFNEPDIIAFQETGQKRAQALLDHVHAQLRPNQLARGRWQLHCQRHLCLASRLPFKFIEAQSRRFRGAWGLLGAAYDVQVKNQWLRVINVHLETPRKGIEDLVYGTIDFGAIRKNAHNREIETELLASWIGDQQPMVALGDFNMMADESLYRRYFGTFRNAFGESGSGFGHTKFTRLLKVRIDHVLSSSGVTPLSARVALDVGSDHRPLLADLTLD